MRFCQHLLPLGITMAVLTHTTTLLILLNKSQSSKPVLIKHRLVDMEIDVRHARSIGTAES